MTTVAFIGLGAMGSRMAARLVDAGHQVVVWNRTPTRTQQLADRGAKPAGSPAEAVARADVVITMVSDAGALQAVTEGPDGVATGVRASTTVIEMSTVGPAAVARLASVLSDGVDLLDAPVLGSLSEAESGTLKIFVGGPSELVDRSVPLLSTLGSPVHVGPLGAGAAAKVLANSTLLGVLGVLGEAVALARGLGLSDDAAFEVLSGTPVAEQAKRRRNAIETGDYPHRFTLSLARKDADLVVEAATAAGVDLRLAKAAQSWFAAAEDDGHGDEDYSAVLARIVAAS